MMRTSRTRIVKGAVLAMAALLVAAAAAAGPEAPERRYTVAFANATEEPGVGVEGTGFTGAEIRQSFVLAARTLPVDLVFYDNHGDDARALANAEDAVGRKVDLYIQYHRGDAVNAAIAQRLKASGIPLLAVNEPVPGAPLYSLDNAAAGRIAGDALAQFAAKSWPGQPTAAIVIGRLATQRERVQGVIDSLRKRLPNARVSTLETQGNPAQVAPLLGALLTSQPTSKLLIAATDDATALAAKSAVEAAGRARDAAIVGHGVDRSIHGGANDRKELDPNNRASIVLGSVAFYLDRIGYQALPLALRMLRGESVPARTATPHKLITPANVFAEYPPYDMN